MAAQSTTRGRLRRLAELRPERGRVLSIFFNLDPSEFATPPARATEINSVVTAAAHKVEELDGLEHDERAALRADVERVREVLRGPTSRRTGPTASAVYACGPADPARDRPAAPIRSSRARCVDDHPCVEPLIRSGPGRAVVRSAREPQDRADLHWRGDRAAGGRPHRGRHAPASTTRAAAWRAHFQRSVEQEKLQPPRRGARHALHALQAPAAVRPPRRGRLRRARGARSSSGCTRTCATGSPAGCTSTWRTSTPSRSAPRRPTSSTRTSPRSSARRSTASSRASAGATAAPRHLGGHGGARAGPRGHAAAGRGLRRAGARRRAWRRRSPSRRGSSSCATTTTSPRTQGIGAVLRF